MCAPAASLVRGLKRIDAERSQSFRHALGALVRLLGSLSVPAAQPLVESVDPPLLASVAQPRARTVDVQALVTYAAEATHSDA